MNQIILINDYIKKVIEEIEAMPEFYKVRIYGGEFNSDDATGLSRSMPKNDQSNALVSYVDAVEPAEKHPSMNIDDMTCMFVVYVLNMSDRGMNGYSSNAIDHCQKVHQLIKNNKFGFPIPKKPKILSMRNLSNQIKQDKEIAKMAVVWSQDLSLASSV